MKKYFIKETDELVELGDVIVVEFSKELEDGNVTVEKEIKVTEDTIEGLIELDIIEEREEKPDLIDFSDEDYEYEALVETVDSLKERIKHLEEVVFAENKKNASPKKK